MLSLCTPAPPGQGRAFPADTGEKEGYSLSKLLKLLSMLLSGQGSAWILPELSVRQGQERPHGTGSSLTNKHNSIFSALFGWSPELDSGPNIHFPIFDIEGFNNIEEGRGLIKSHSVI